jgi:multidrug resistance efflux pump
MKKAVWVGVAIAIAVAGAWGYGALARREDDSGRPVRLLAIAEEQSLALSFSRSGRLITPVPDEGETVKKGDTVARIEEPGLSEDASDYQRQMAEAQAREKSRQQDVARLQAQLAEATSEERRIGRLVKEGIAPAADLETVQHRREGITAEIRAREAEKGQIGAASEALEVRLGKVRRFEKEGALIAPATGTVLTRHHRQRTCAWKCPKSGSRRSLSESASRSGPRPGPTRRCARESFRSVRARSLRPAAIGVSRVAT